MSVLMLSCTLCFAGASAQSVQRCDGKYERARAIVDKAYAQYGTIYSGGDHHDQLDGLDATIELYRALTGLPPLDWRSTPAPEAYRMSADDWRRWKFGEGIPETEIRKALTLMTQEAPNLHAGEMRNASIVLNMATSIGPRNDWWLRPEEFNHLTETQKRVARLAGDVPALDWLQTALVLSAELYPWALDGLNSLDEDTAGLMQHVRSRSNSSLSWWPLRLELERRYDPRDDTRQFSKTLIRQIKSCTASEQEYLAVSSSLGPVMHNYLPQSLAHARIEQRAKRLMLGRISDRTYRELLATTDHLLGSGVSLPLILMAPTPEALKEHFDPSQRIVRSLNLLSARELEGLYPHIAMARHFALGDYAAADRLLLDHNILGTLPASAKAMGIDHLPPNIKLAMVILRTPCISTNVSAHCENDPDRFHLHRDLPKQYAWGAPLQLDLEGWLFGLVQPYSDRRYADFGPVDGRHRARSRARGRAKSRFGPGYISPVPLDSYRRPAALVEAQTGLAARVAWDELGPLTTENRLSRQLSLAILNWVDPATTSRWDRFWVRDKELMAEALHLVVYLNKHENGGTYKGKPVGQAAFEILHRRFPNSDWTVKTKYWWSRTR